MATNPPSSPSRLYKYLAPDRATVLSQRLLRHTPLSAFNDPFEGRPEITRIMSDEAAAELVHDEITKLFRPLIEAADACAEKFLSLRKLPTRLQAVDKIHDELQAVRKGLEEVEALAMSGQSEMVAQIQSQTNSAMMQLQRQLDKQVGVFSLSEVPDSLLMWSHYGASHMGFILEFNAYHPYFCNSKPPDDTFHQLHRVLYREARPSSQLDKMSGDDLFLVKSGHWAYEREWRILRPLSEASSTIPAVPFPIHLYEFPHDAVTGVILGARATAATRALLISALCSEPEYKHVRLRNAVPDSSHFLLTLVDESI